MLDLLLFFRDRNVAEIALVICVAWMLFAGWLSTTRHKYA